MAYRVDERAIPGRFGLTWGWNKAGVHSLALVTAEGDKGVVVARAPL